MFKKLVLALAIIGVMALPSYAAVAFTPSILYGNAQTEMVIIKINCVGISDGAATDALLINDARYPAIMKLINHRWLMYATSVPSAVTAPDAADLQVFQYIGGSTATVNMFGTNGVNLIHATATYTAYPQATSGSSANAYYQITGPLLVDLENQGSAGGIVDIYLWFSK